MLAVGSLSASGAVASGFGSNDKSHSRNASPVGVFGGHLTNFSSALRSVNSLEVLPDQHV